MANVSWQHINLQENNFWDEKAPVFGPNQGPKIGGLKSV
jgi:hypothetical protein